MAQKLTGMGGLRTLAIETTSLTGTLAAFEDGHLLAAMPLDSTRRSAQSLAPGIRDLLQQLGWRPADIQLVAVAAGPGSFTGLRVGITTAKTLAYAVGAQIVAVNTLEVIAEQAPAEARPLWCILDAHRGQVFCGRFTIVDEGTDSPFQGTTVVDIDAWLAALAPGDFVSGPILPRLAERLSAGIRPTPPETWSPTAAGVGRLALRRYAVGQRDDIWRLTPWYFRASAAEEKRARPLER